MAGTAAYWLPGMVVHLFRGGTAHSCLGPSVSVGNQENAS